MNGLLVNSYHTAAKPSKPEPEVNIIPNRGHYHTWPKKRKSKKRKISHIINHLKREHAISEINLNLQTSNLLRLSFDTRNKTDKDKESPYSSDKVQKKNQLNGTDGKYEEENNNSDKTSDSCIVLNEECSAVKKVECLETNDRPEDDLFSENNLGIIRILKK